MAAGPAPGVAYAGLGIRIVAYIIDAILLGIVGAFLFIALGAIFPGSVLGGNLLMALVFGVLLAIANLVISAVYFLWGWTNPEMRASLGQRALGLQTLNASDGSTLTRPQAVRRWACLYGIFAVASALQLALGGSDLATLASLIGLADLRVLDLPAVGDKPEPEEAGLPRRPGGDGGRQAGRLTRTSARSNGAGNRRPRSDSRRLQDASATETRDQLCVGACADPGYGDAVRAAEELAALSLWCMMGRRTVGGGGTPLGLEVEAPHVARPEHRDRPPVERGHPPDPEPLRGGDEQRVGEPRAVLRGLRHELGGARRGPPGSAARGGSTPPPATR